MIVKLTPRGTTRLATCRRAARGSAKERSVSITNSEYERGRAQVIAEMRALGMLDEIDLRIIRHMEAARHAQPVNEPHPAIIAEENSHA